MPMWRCPHCATPQPEAARCWVCHRSSTSCATCRHFRRSVAGGLGYCGLDRGRSPLRGDELRGCWEWPVLAEPAPAAMVAISRTPVRSRRDFVPLDTDAGLPAATVIEADIEPPRRPESGRWNLFPEVEL